MSAVAVYSSVGELTDEVTFIVTLKDKDGMPVPHAAINVALIGGGSLQPDGGRPGLPFVFQETDESGTVRFSWLSGLDQPSEVILNASSARGDSLSIRQL